MRHSLSNPIGIEGAGIIHSLGEASTLLKKGDRVSILPAFDSFLNSLGESAAYEASIIIYGAALFNEDTSYPLFPSIAKGLDVSSVKVSIQRLSR